MPKHCTLASLRTVAQVSLPLMAALLFGGCDKSPTAREREYVYTRPEPPDAFAKSNPGEETVYVVRLRVDESRRTVAWKEVALFRGVAVGGPDLREWRNCTILNAENWDCRPEVIEELGIVEKNHVWMDDGVLFQDYWGEHREFRVRWVASQPSR